MIASLPLGKSLSRLTVAAVALALASACGPAAQNGGAAGDGASGMREPVYDVTEVSIDVVESATLQIRIRAAGHARTGGWSDAALVLDEEASEGIRLVYAFVAVPPDGMATQALTPIDASVLYGPWVDRAAREITVVAETNSQTVTFPGPAEE